MAEPSVIFKLVVMTVQSNKQPVTLRCPACRQLGTFDAVNGEVLFIHSPPVLLGHRRCPNRTCRAHVFVAFNPEGQLLISYPPERIDFDSTLIPKSIVNSLQETITCHANGAFTAAAIMVRRTLEDLCANKKARGNNLKERIAALGSSILLPPGLLKGIDNLRLLGNDAAHVEAQVYNSIGKTEVELAIDVAKEVLKAVYQLDSLVARLEKLKQPKP